MRATGKIESLSYGTIYVTGCAVALFLSMSQRVSLQDTIMHVLFSWGYVLYWVWHY